MKFFNKLYYIPLVLVLVLFTPTPSSALLSSGIGQGNADMIGNIINAAANPSTIAAQLLPGSMAALLCAYRWQLCGRVELIIVATAVFLIGLLILNNKAKWTYIVLIAVFTILLTKPEKLASALMTNAHFTIVPGVQPLDPDISFMRVFAEVCTCANRPPEIL